MCKVVKLLFEFHIFVRPISHYCTPLPSILSRCCNVEPFYDFYDSFLVCITSFQDKLVQHAKSLMNIRKILRAEPNKLG